MSLLSNFISRSALSPLDRLVQDTTRSLQSKFENSVDSLFTSGLKSIGISSSVASELSARFGDSVVHELADSYFKTSTSAQNRVTKQNICDNFLPSFSETNSQAIERINSSPNFKANTQTIYQYPTDLGQTKYYIAFNFREYVRTAPQSQAKLDFVNSVLLPIPANLIDAFDINLSATPTGTLGGVADLIQSRKNIADSATATSYAAAVSSFEKLSSGITDVLGQYTGSIPNPHLATIFNGINMRTHEFQWTFAPRTPEESDKLVNIINVLKQNSLPSFSNLGTAILQYPFLCFIDLYPWAETKGGELIKYKAALVSDVKFNYSPNGVPSFFAGTQQPSFIELSISVLETEYATAADYGRGGRKDDKVQAVVDNTVNIGNALLRSSTAGAAIADGIQQTSDAIKKAEK